MSKVLPLISLFIISIISIFYWTLKPKNELYDAKWNATDTTLAITINGEISTTFPTTNAYTGTVECTTGTGKVEWNGTKWVLTTSGITKGSTKCNAIFYKKPTFAETILANNEVKTPITTPGAEVNAHTLDDIIDTSTSNVSTKYQSYYFTYGTGWKANGSNFDLTGAAVTSDTYANSYSSLVGKYLPSTLLWYAGSSTAGKMQTTTNLDSVYYVVSATSSSFTYKKLTSNKNITEALLASAEDDYGTSYYFRGTVKNNYVEFANKCWRIVRIVGDGSVKLVLHNDNTSKASNPCSLANNDTSAAFARYSGSTYTSAFNEKHDDNAYVGFMYGTAGASNYASTHANINKSIILNNLETWYTNNLARFDSRLADTIWCNDKSTVNGLGYGADKTDYGAFSRLYSTKTPTLICQSDNDGGKLSKFTVNDIKNGNGNLTYKIGLLTADELMFAGYAYNLFNYGNYLQENATDTEWWSLSPQVFGLSYSIVWIANISFGYYDSPISVSGNWGVRPAISLISSTTISGGSGTSEDPYVVE